MRPLLLLVTLFAAACSRGRGVVDAGVPVASASPERGLDAGAATKPVVVQAGEPPALPPTRFALAWIAEVDGVPQVMVDGRLLTRGPAHYVSAVAPGGVWATRSAEELEQLVFVALDGGVTTFGEPSMRAKAAAPLGAGALYERGAPGALSHLVTTDGRVVIDDPAGSFEPSVAPDGGWFAFVSSRDGDAEIYRASLDGGALQRLTAFHLDDVGPRVSPDGAWIAFVSNREGSDRLFLVRPDGRGQRRLHRDDSVDARWDAGEVEAAEGDLAWTPDSRAIVFSARSARGRWHLFRADVATGARARLTDGDHDDQLPTVSPDGAWIVFVSNRSGDPELWALGPDGGVQQVTKRQGADWRPLWLPARLSSGAAPAPTAIAW